MVLLQSILDELNITRNVIDLFIVVGLALVFIFIVSCIMDVSKVQKGANKYMDLFKEHFEREKDIKETMKKVLGEYKSNTMEAKALKAGIYHLEHTIMKDYSSALKYIEDVFESEEVHKMHEEYLEEVLKSRTLALESPTNETSENDTPVDSKKEGE